MNFVGLDLGTSAVKTVLVDVAGRVIAEADHPVAWETPRPLWSQSDPRGWWDSAAATLDDLARREPKAMSGVVAIGLSGQMHGAVALDAADEPLRPAILWNDGRAHAEADELAARGGPEWSDRLGVRPMPGLTGPKLLWMARNEPDLHKRIRSLLLAKDYLRLRMTGERITDASDAAGTWYFDQYERAWSGQALDWCEVNAQWLPRVCEGDAPAGRLRAELAARWGMAGPVTIAAGGGDAATGAVGAGVVAEGDAMMSMGTSAQIVVAADRHRPASARMVHAFCHALPGRWYQMAAMLSGASPMAVAARWLKADIGELLAECEAAFKGPSRLLSLPYLVGERTPHNDPFARGAIFGLDAATTRADMTQAVLEGTAFMLADARAALEAAGAHCGRAALIGGGARSPFWAKLIASATGIELTLSSGAQRGPAFGAARLAILSAGKGDASTLAAPAVERTIAPDRELFEAYRPRIERFRELYRALKPEFAKG
ncbi:MAG: xylulokinase [Hyphomicrobiales bacterium]|nr:xylulokinase [Hyphomicrobiales bacterium]